MIICIGLLLLFMAFIIYFLSRVCIQFNNINNISLQFGMDVTKLYSDEYYEGLLGYINFLVKSTAMKLYKFKIFINKKVKHR